MLDLQTRFLYTFTFKVAGVVDALKAMCTEVIEGRALWGCAEPPFHYKDELLDHVGRFLFPDTGAGQCEGESSLKGCAYLKLSDAQANHWFRDLKVVRTRGVNAGGKGEERHVVTPVAGPRFEVFLSPQGVGVLSIALAPKQAGLTPKETTEFNYRIAQYRRHPIATFRRRHPADDPATFDRLAPENRERVPAAPASDAPLEDRLGAPGGSFALPELIGVLLKPLLSHGLAPVAEGLKELTVYTVVRFGPEVDFGDPTVRDALAPLLSSLAQVEEEGHSGAARPAGRRERGAQSAALGGRRAAGGRAPGGRSAARAYAPRIPSRQLQRSEGPDRPR